MPYLKWLRQYSAYTVVVVVLLLGVFARTNYGCGSHIGTSSGFADVAANDTVFFTYRAAEPDAYEYGELVVYRPRTGGGDVGNAVVVGRVLGKPGDVVEIREGTLYRNDAVDGEALAEPGFGSTPPLTVPRDTLYVLGNTASASDSRRYGPIPIGLVRGAATFARE